MITNKSNLIKLARRTIKIQPIKSFIQTNHYLQPSCYTNNSTLSCKTRSFTTSLSILGKKPDGLEILELGSKGSTCPGCGAVFQSEDSKQPGFMPEIKPIDFIEPKIKANDNKLVMGNNKSIDKDTAFDILASLSSQLEGNLNYENVDLDNIKSFNKELYINSKQLLKVTPKSLKKEELNNKDLICQRCYYLDHHNKIKTDWETNSKVDLSYLSFLLNKSNSILIYVVDIFDMSGSLVKGLREAVLGPDLKRKLVVVVNKIDLLPSTITTSTIRRFVNSQLAHVGLVDSVLGVFFISAKQQLGINKMTEFLKDIGHDQSNLYLIGCTNVGKSQLVNSLLGSHRFNQQVKITTSVVPGTTMAMIKVPLNKINKLSPDTKFTDVALYDTPGIFNPRQLLHYLTHNEMKKVIPSKPFPIRTYQWFKGRSLFIGGLVRLDFVEGSKPAYITIYTQVPIHMTSIEKADLLMAELNTEKPTILSPPDTTYSKRVTTFPLANMKSTANSPIKIPLANAPYKASIDICLSGLGWISIAVWPGPIPKTKEEMVINAYSRGGFGVTTRSPFISNIKEFKVMNNVPNITGFKSMN